MKYFASLLRRILNFFFFKLASRGGSASYWSSYMVDHKEFNDVNESLEHFERRNPLYPALENINLSSEHRNFLSKVQFDENNHPIVDGNIAGINACFKFYK